MRFLAFVCVAFVGLGVFGEAYGDESTDARWIERFRHDDPHVEFGGVCKGTVGALPHFTVTPDRPGERLVRVSMPFAPASFPAGLCLTAIAGETETVADVRVLTYHPGQPASLRRAILTFPFEFESTEPVTFSLGLSNAQRPPEIEPARDSDAYVAAFKDGRIKVAPNAVTVENAQGVAWRATVIAPEQSELGEPVFETIEAGAHYLWVRLLVPDTAWPRIIEVRADSEGTVTVQVHVQRLAEGDAFAPELGWNVTGLDVSLPVEHSFVDGQPWSLATNDEKMNVSFPVAPLTLKGSVAVASAEGGPVLTYYRSSEDDRVPFQSTAWRRAAVTVGPIGHTPVNALLEPDLKVRVPPEAFNAIYGMGASPDLSLHPLLDDAQEFHRDAIAASALRGDDFGNVTSFNPGAPASYYGMNRLNHGPAIFEESYRASSEVLRETAVLWCSNMHDLSIWWGDTPDFGGTRYNAAVAAGEKEHEGDTSYLWRTNWSSHFCTKGYDAFFYAYEETGDPRMLTALNAQVNYAKGFIHTNTGECRNIGDVSDYMHLYRFTGVPLYRDEALRLFRELREKLSPGDLFSQGGQLIVDDGPFIDDDQHGYEAPFAKPYIIGYALAGLPALLEEFPDEPKLRDVVRAVAVFLADSQDPVGGWRYPHPQSSAVLISQGLEHAMQLVRAAGALESRGEDIGELLNAIERVLQGRIEGYRRSGAILGGLTGWERSTGAIPEGKTIYDLYQKPAERDPSRDYTEGSVGIGGSPPDGLVHWGEVLQFYLAHRPAERLFNRNDALNKVLVRVEDRRLTLTPQESGSFLRVARPDNSEVAFTLWGPEWVSFPNLGFAEDASGDMAIDWRHDAHTGAMSYTIDRPEATFTAQFTPCIDYLECAYTVWPKPDAEVPDAFEVAPCVLLKDGIFVDKEPERADHIAFVSNGEWIVGTTGEFADSNCNNASAPQRSMHSQVTTPLNPNGPTTLWTRVFLFKGTLGDLQGRPWRDAAHSPPQGLQRTADYGVRDFLPSFNTPRVRRMEFSLAWEHADAPFAEWREQARAAYLDALQTPPPPAPFAAEVIGEEDRGAYLARKLAMNISADERVKAYLLIPKGDGPFPALVALHDHGAHFSIGKEKVVRPFDEPAERIADAEDWVSKYYGGKFIGDEMAKRGYVVFATDALFWGDRGRYGGVEYEDQQALGANMLQLGQSWAGTIVWDDIRGAEFVQSVPEVDPDRIGCMGLSMGSHRTWSLAAATDIIKAGAAICWMGDTPTLASPGNNQTKGYSSFSMIHPGIREVLDYPDVASIACPKPMLFFNGTEDGLFPVAGVEAAYEKMRGAWESQGVSDRLVTKLWPVPHEFNADMQSEAFDWLDRWLKDGG